MKITKYKLSVSRQEIAAALRTQYVLDADAEISFDVGIPLNQSDKYKVILDLLGSWIFTPDNLKIERIRTLRTIARSLGLELSCKVANAMVLSPDRAYTYIKGGGEFSNFPLES